MDNSIDYLFDINDTTDLQILTSIKDYTLPNVNIDGYANCYDYSFVDPKGYSIVCTLGDISDGVDFYTKSKVIVINSKSSKNLMSNFHQLLPKASQRLGVTVDTAYNDVTDFFKDKTIVVQHTGLQKKVYLSMRYLQNTLPAMQTYRAVTIAKTIGLTGKEIITKAPMTTVGTLYLGALFFEYCSIACGDNIVGRACGSIGWTCSRPMWCVETVLNGLFLRPLSHFIGLPMILNATQEIQRGAGLDLKDAAQISKAYNRISNSVVVDKCKKIVAIVREGRK